jgi:Cu2+-exporting ATPase
MSEHENMGKQHQHGEHQMHEGHGNQGQHDAHNDHGMDHNGHEGHGVDHTGHEIMFRNRFWLSLALTIPILLFSEMLQQWFGFSMPTFPGSQWIGPIFSSSSWAACPSCGWPCRRSGGASRA